MTITRPAVKVLRTNQGNEPQSKALWAPQRYAHRLPACRNGLVRLLTAMHLRTGTDF